MLKILLKKFIKNSKFIKKYKKFRINFKKSIWMNKKNYKTKKYLRVKTAFKWGTDEKHTKKSSLTIILTHKLFFCFFFHLSMNNYLFQCHVCGCKKNGTLVLVFVMMFFSDWFNPFLNVKHNVGLFYVDDGVECTVRLWNFCQLLMNDAWLILHKKTVLGLILVKYWCFLEINFEIN